MLYADPAILTSYTDITSAQTVALTTLSDMLAVVGDMLLADSRLTDDDRSVVYAAMNDINDALAAY